MHAGDSLWLLCKSSFQFNAIYPKLAHEFGMSIAHSDKLVSVVLLAGNTEEE